MSVDFRWLMCVVCGHDPQMLNGTYFVACRRCDAVLNLRISTWRSQ